MWWLWPHLRRLWAGVGTLTAGLTVTYLYNLWSKQAVPDLRSLSSLLHDYWVWTGGGLLALATVSVVAERAHRQHEARAPRPLRARRASACALLASLKRPRSDAALVASVQSVALAMVGRATELARLKDRFEQVKAGTRRIIFLSGEPGIGKTTLTRFFLDSLSNDRAVQIGRGQCVEQYGAGEPYMPVLEALTRLSREPGGGRLVEILHRLAPAWLAQMPSLVSAEDRFRLQGQAQGTTQRRMLREMAEALEVMAADAPLVLLLEDLHWSDPSTLDLIATIARRLEPARLMILGTYRPVEMLGSEHPLRAMKEELELHQQCVELRLPLLSEADIAMYIARRFEEGKQSLVRAIYRRTEGNPLFMVNVVDYLLEQGSLHDADTIEAPRNIRQMIERNLQRLTPDEQRVLEAASVAGAEFSAAAVAAALERPATEIEACCAALARREQFIGARGRSNWPDGTIASSFNFHHALYREALYTRVPAGHTVNLHRRIAERMEAAYDGQVNEIAAELSDHYRRANEAEKAVRYLQLSAEQAIERRAYRETEQHYRGALAMLPQLPESTERDRRELNLQLALGGIMAITRGWAAIDTDAVYARARTLARRADADESLEALNGLCNAAINRGQPREALVLADQVLEIARGISSRRALITAHFEQGVTRLSLGDPAVAQQHLLQAISLYREEDFRGVADDHGVHARTFAGGAEWFLGYPDSAQRQTHDARALARRLNKPFAVAYAEVVGGWTDGWRGDFGLARAAAKEGERLSTELGFPQFSAVGKILGAWACARMGEPRGAMDSVRAGLAEADAIKSYYARGLFLCSLAETQALAGSLDDAVVTVGRALETNPDEIIFRPLALTLRGKLSLRKQPDRVVLAEQDFREAIELSRKMSAKSLELLATIALARLLRDTGRREDAHTMLAEIHGWFTEGFDTRDLKEAKALLDELNKERA